MSGGHCWVTTRPAVEFLMEKVRGGAGDCPGDLGTPSPEEGAGIGKKDSHDI